MTEGTHRRPLLLDEAASIRLVERLLADHERVLGPVLRDGAIAIEPIEHPDELVRGRGAEQSPGRYRVVEDPDGAWFAWAAPVRGLKGWVHPSRTQVASAHRPTRDDPWVLDPPPGPPSPSTAVLGARACDVAALGVLERVFASGVEDPTVAARRPSLLVAVACTVSADACFCASAGTGPAPGEGADVVLTELVAGSHRFVAEARTERGADLLEGLELPAAPDVDVAEAAAAVARAAAAQHRRLDPTGLPGALLAATSSPRWQEVAERCLACGACTGVCPTCSCTAVDDTTDVAGTTAERWQVWDSCFSLGFSELHGGAVRTSTSSRYRQWLTHKLDTWFAQYGESGCVGCGRCTTWCPVGIDLLAEADAVRADPGGTPVAIEGSA